MSASRDNSAREKHKETGAAWNVTAAIYGRDEADDLALLRSGGNSLTAPEFPFLQNLNRWCGRAIHLQCAGGTDTFSGINFQICRPS